MVTRNPFKPTAGARPPLLVGRNDALDSFREGLEDGPGSPGLLTIFTGPRGVGKTVMLTEAEALAREQNWVVISETATKGLISRLADSIQGHLEELGDGKPSRRVTGVVAAGFGVTTQLPPTRPTGLRERATALLTRLAGHDTGLLITVDEIHAVDREDLTELAAIVQHLIREDLPIGLLMAGIPKAVADLLNENVSTFLRRADRIDLTGVPVQDVREALARTFADTGVTIEPAQVDLAAEATGGYPFLIQLVGYHVWRRAVEGTVTDKSLAAGVYRRRLLDAGIIVDAGRGLTDFAVPHLREYLREHTDAMSQPNLP